MSALPWILLGGGAVALGAYVWTREGPQDEAGPLPGRWVWPVGVWRGRKPEISSGFGSPRRSRKGERIEHGGVDILYRRAAGDPWLPGSPNGSRGYVMPDHRAALAASDGIASYAQNTPRGWTVIVDHAPHKLATYYTHLSQLLVVPKQAVSAGQPIGIIGADPLDRQNLKHLHFALWRGGPKDRVDPEPYMRTWGYMPDPGDMPIALAQRNAAIRRWVRPRLPARADSDRRWHALLPALMPDDVSSSAEE
jgi:hypothetical protein